MCFSNRSRDSAPILAWEAHILGSALLTFSPPAPTLAYLNAAHPVSQQNPAPHSEKLCLQSSSPSWSWSLQSATERSLGSRVTASGRGDQHSSVVILERGSWDQNQNLGRFTTSHAWHWQLLYIMSVKTEMKTDLTKNIGPGSAMRAGGRCREPSVV